MNKLSFQSVDTFVFSWTFGARRRWNASVCKILPNFDIEREGGEHKCKGVMTENS